MTNFIGPAEIRRKGVRSDPERLQKRKLKKRVIFGFFMISCFSGWSCSTSSSPASSSLTSSDSDSSTPTLSPTPSPTLISDFDDPHVIDFTGQARTNCTATLEDPFFCIKEACSAVKGKYNPSNHICECNDPTTFFTPHFGGHCLPLKASIAQLSVNELQQRIAENPNPSEPLYEVLIETPAVLPHDRTILQSKIGFKFGKMSQSDSDSLLNSIKNQESALFSQAKLPFVPGTVFQMKILSGDGPVREQLLQNLDIIEIRPFFGEGSQGIVRYYWEPDVDQWSPLITRQKRQELPSRLDLLRTGDSWDDLRTALNKAWNIHTKIGSETFQPEVETSSKAPGEASGAASGKEFWKKQFFSQDGCAGHCILEHTERFDGYQFKEMQEYGGGLLIRHQIKVEELGLPIYHARYAVLEIDPSDSPNTIYLLEIKPDQDSGDLAQSIEVYSKKGEFLFSSNEFPLIEQFANELAIRDASINLTSEDTSSIVLCEGGLVPSSLSLFNRPKFRVGPMTTESFWGWLGSEVPSFSIREQLSGLASLSEVYRPVLSGTNLQWHSALVSLLATKDTDLSVIPFNVEQCFSDYSRWKTHVKPYSKVVNVSAILSFDYKTCEKDPWFQKPLTDQQQPFLWVLGAGNDGRSNLTSEKALGCPQSWGPYSNLLIVTAKDDGVDRISSYADSGRYYADIAADGSGMKPGEMGTSFATPRVSRVAALIAQDFPNLTVEQIRASILLGARIPYKPYKNDLQPLPTRSGGILDEVGARRVAGYISRIELKESMTWEIASQILHNLDCNKNVKSKECQLAKFKLDWMKDTRAFP